MINDKPFQVSIVMPMRNAEKYITKTLKNILQQQNIDFEIIIVDDKSTDKSAELVRSFNHPRIKLMRGKGLGISEALNLGYRAASGEIIVRCDADDYICPNDRLVKQYTFLKENPNYQATCGNFWGMDQNDNNLGSFNCGEVEADITNDIKNGNLRAHFCTYAIKKELFEKVGGFRSYFVTAEDVDFQLRICEHTNIMYFPTNLYQYRLHGNSITHLQPENSRLAYEKMAKHFQKQRLNNGKDDLELGIQTPINENLDSSKPTSANDHVIGIAIANSWALHNQKKKMQAIQLLWSLMRSNPFSFLLFKNILMLIIK